MASVADDGSMGIADDGIISAAKTRMAARHKATARKGVFMHNRLKEGGG
jgi:hypothetical protein